MSSPAADALARERAVLIQAFQEAAAPDFSLRHAQLFDAYFRERLEEHWSSVAGEAPAAPCAVVAVGGYGRSELCVHSDIDVLILYAGDVPETSKALAKALFFPLWDQNLDLGHGVRSIPECLELATQDYKVFASLLDARFLAGAPGVFGDFEAGMRQTLLPGRG